MAKVLRHYHIAERTEWPEGVPSADLLLVQSPDGTTGVDVWWLEESEERDIYRFHLLDVWMGQIDD